MAAETRAEVGNPDPAPAVGAEHPVAEPARVVGPAAVAAVTELIATVFSTPMARTIPSALGHSRMGLATRGVGHAQAWSA